MKVIVVYEGPGESISDSSFPPGDDKYTDPVRLTGHTVTEHGNGTVEVRVKWEYP